MDKSQYALPDFYHQALNQKRINILVNTEDTRSYLSNFDMFDGIYKSLNLPKARLDLSIRSSASVRMSGLTQFITNEINKDAIMSNPSNEGDIYVADNHQTFKRLDIKEIKIWQENGAGLIDQAKASKRDPAGKF